MIKVLALGKYGSLGASTRLRLFQYERLLLSAGLDITFQSLLSDKMLRSRYAHGTYRGLSLVRAYISRIQWLLRRRKFDLIWIEKEALPWLPQLMELMLLQGVPFVLDYDDAVFHNYDQHKNRIFRRLYGRRLDGLMAEAKTVVVGNGYLAERARNAGCRRLESIPTVVDLDRYPLPIRTEKSNRESVIGWIGSPSTAKYLRLASDALGRLQEEFNIRCVAIGAKEEDLVGTPFRSIPWCEDTEVSSLNGLDIGIMPLADTPWERGKCGYKLIQYMASGLPVVASPVGVNNQIVKHGVNGFLASTQEEWIDCLEKLVSDVALRARLGAAGRKRVEREFCLQVQAPRLAEILLAAARN